MLSSHRIPFKGFNAMWIFAISALTITIWSGSVVVPVYGAPANLDSNIAHLPLELQPPLFLAAALTDDDTNASPSATDSYGNPIESLKPIDTPDGRKVVSAQGLQFEIPTYASGITDIKKPAEDLLPPFIDPISSSETETAQDSGKQKPSNPFLPHNNGAYNPQILNRETTSTTSTTTTAAPIEKNPFDSATLPSWLSDLDYPEVGPGVPFVYNPNDGESDVNNDLLPPSNIEAQATDTVKPVFVTSSPESFNNFNFPTTRIPPQSFTHQQPTLTPASSSFLSSSLSSSSSFPSKVALPIPSIQTNPNENANAVTTQHIAFAPSTGAEDRNVDNAILNTIKKNSSPSSNKHFTAPFEPSATAESTPVPVPINDETFPPQQEVPTKTTFIKSGDGKVITTNVFQQGAQSGAKPFGFSSSNFGTPQKDFQSTPSNHFFASSAGFASGINNVQDATSFSGSSLSKAPTTGIDSTTFSNVQTTKFGSSEISKGSTAFAASSGAFATTAAGKYTGGFGGAPGVLGSGHLGSAIKSSENSPITTQNRGSFGITPQQPTPTPPALNAASFGSHTVSVSTTSTNTNKYRGSFGGPPGILNPYDNVNGDKL